MSAPERIAPRPVHLARLMALWRSAGWPCRDGIELDLMAAGWIQPVTDSDGRETLRLTPTGIELLQQARRRRVRSASLHDRLAARICEELHRQGRIVWRELALRAPLADAAPPSRATPRATSLPGLDTEAAMAEQRPTAWRSARPDIYSIRYTTREARLYPIVHEIKASRADLLADLRDATKGEAYRSVSCETYYVLPAGLADAAEIPEDFGLWTLEGTPEDGILSLQRSARYVDRLLDFGIWMALARATPVREIAEPVQSYLASHDDDGSL